MYLLSRGVGSSDFSYTPIFIGSFISMDHKQVRLQFAYVPYFNRGIQTVWGEYYQIMLLMAKKFTNKLLNIWLTIKMSANN